jgi:GTP-binding protein
MPGNYELDLMGWFYHYKIPAILILTKADKLSKTKQIKQHLSISKALSVDKKNLILFSIKSRQGKDDVWDAIEKLLQEDL